MASVTLRAALGTLTLLVVACEPTAPPDGLSPTPPPGDVDFDGDGTTGDDGDCDDLDRDVGPDAPERCDGIDNDCDDDVDELGALDAGTWHADGDDDGWGDPDFTLQACEPPNHFVENGEDCDDSRDDVRPGAPERCDVADNDCDGLVDEGEPIDQSSFRPDQDGDGFGLDEGHVMACAAPPGYVADSGKVDCDDTDATVYPGAPEICDEQDNDCDGQSDEPGAQGAPAWYNDVDGDGYGEAATAQTLCAGPEGWVRQAGDCDEGDPAINPGAPELCHDEADNDCDDQVDEDGAADARAWFLDRDEDGFGDPAVDTRACDPPVGYVSPNTDCDDSDPTVSPAAEERCDAVDDDCDGVVDEDGAIDARPWYLDGDADGWGTGDPAPACQRPDGFAAEEGDCDDEDGAVHPGAEEIGNDGKDNDCDGGPGSCNLRARSPYSLGGADVTILGAQAGALTGEDVAFAGDVNGDGLTDVIVGAWSLDVAGVGADAGGAYLFYGPITDKVDAQGRLSVTRADVTLYGEQAGDHAGTSVRSAGDVNGDGFSDLLIGANRGQVSRPYQGVAYLLYGPLSPGVRSLATADVRLLGEGNSDFAGAFVAAAGDVNGDGLGDILVAAPGHDAPSRVDAGAVYLLYGPLGPGDLSLSHADVRLTGEAAGDAAGYGVSGGGDFNGDGLADLLVGAPYNDEGGDSEGKVYVIHGPIPRGTDSPLNQVADAQLVGEALGHGAAGYSVAVAGDLNGDGFDDALIGAPTTDPMLGQTDNGTVYTVYGPMTGHRSLGSPQDVYLDGLDGQDQAGISVTGAGDLDGDGHHDFLLGAWRETDLSYRAGAVRLFYGPVIRSGTVVASPVVFLGEAEGDQAGVAIDAGGDVNGDGYRDILIGALGSDSGGLDAGAVYLVLGVGL